MVLIGTYSSRIIYLALATSNTLPFRDLPSIASCIEHGKCGLITHTLSMSYYDRIFTAKPGDPRHVIKTALMKQPPKIIPRTLRLLDVILQSKDVYYMLFTSGPDYAQLIANSDPCTVDSMPFAEHDVISFPLPKGAEKLRFEINRAILHLQGDGIMDHLLQKYVGNYLQMQNRCKGKPLDSRAMPLVTFSGAFLALIAGFILSGLTLLTERVLARRGNRKRSHPSIASVSPRPDDVVFK